MCALPAPLLMTDADSRSPPRHDGLMTPMPSPRIPDPLDAPVIRWGVLAPGGIARDWTAALHARTASRVAAVGSRSLERAQAFAINDLGRSFGLRVGHGVFGLIRFHGPPPKLPDLAPNKPPASGPTGINRCGTIVGSSSSPDPTNGNPVPAIWTKAACD